MGWKDFFKLTKWKIILTAILAFIGFILCLAGKMLGVTGGSQPFYVPILTFFCRFSIPYYDGIWVLIKYFLFIVVCYLIVCIIQFVRYKSDK